MSKVWLRYLPVMFIKLICRLSRTFIFDVRWSVSIICPARQPGIFTEIPPRDSFNLLDSIWCFSRNVERFQNLCSFARWRNIQAWAYYKIGMCLTLRKFTLQYIGSKKPFYSSRWLKASFKFNEKKRCIVYCPKVTQVKCANSFFVNVTFRWKFARKFTWTFTAYRAIIHKGDFF